MITIICLMILANFISGESIEPYLDRLRGINWKSYAAYIGYKIKDYSKKAGRTAAKPLLQLWYVLQDEATPVKDKAIIYGALLYVVLPGSLIPQRIFKILGIMDEGAALLVVYKKVNSLITPQINEKVRRTLNEWFGFEYTIKPADQN